MSKAQKKSAPVPKGGTSADHPLFFRKPAVVDKEIHAKAGMKRNAGYAFARQTNSVMVNIHEFVDIARSYPIVFTPGSSPMPLAVVGLKHTNQFVEKDGSWREGCYVPAYARKYPFALIEQADKGGKMQYILCVDEDSPHYQAESPEAPFYVEGKPGLMMQQAMELCALFQRQQEPTRAFGELLAKQGLLMRKEVGVNLKNGEQAVMGGFQLINEEAFNNLSSKDLLTWRDKGWLGLVYLALSSHANWKYLADCEVK